MSIPFEPTVLCHQCKCSFEPNYSLKPVSFELRRSTYIPERTEKTQILNTIQDEENLVEQYDREIIRLHLLTEKLEKEKAMAVEHIEKLRSSLITLRRLPVEILGHIFSLVCAARSEDTGYSRRPRCVLGGSLHSVGGGGRFSIGSPNMWASISVYIDEFYHYGALQILLQYLERSTGSPLDLHLRGPVGYGVDEVAFDPAMLQALTKELSRCKTLGVHEALPFLTVVPDIGDMQFPLPETLRLGDIGAVEEEVDAPMDMDNCFWRGIRDNAPRLLHCQIPLSPLILPFLPWARLTSLHLIFYQQPDNTRLLQHLSTAPQLDSLTVDFRRYEDDVIFPDIQVELKSLRHLEARSEYATTVATLFNTITVPSLQHLYVSANSMDVVISQEEVPLGSALINMIKRSSCAVSDMRLEVDDTLARSCSLSSIFLVCPSMARLDLAIKGGLTDDKMIFTLLSSLTIADSPSSLGFDTKNETTQTLLPKLTSFDLSVDIRRISIAGRVMDSFLRVAESRVQPCGVSDTGGVCSLREIGLCFELKRVGLFILHGRQIQDEKKENSEYFAREIVEFKVRSRKKKLRESGTRIAHLSFHQKTSSQRYIV
ncbi:hypothetical protein AAF712_004368 [Marasmius tenuissimus]|uniref:F-box domain-containing protein n=1 Tax=Marasmius tenuissimus TaxID=585030 RepID=A0ABR3A7Y3_9AGAR